MNWEKHVKLRQSWNINAFSPVALCFLQLAAVRYSNQQPPSTAVVDLEGKELFARSRPRMFHPRPVKHSVVLITNKIYDEKKSQFVTLVKYGFVFFHYSKYLAIDVTWLKNSDKSCG